MSTDAEILRTAASAACFRTLASSLGLNVDDPETKAQIDKAKNMVLDAAVEASFQCESDPVGTRVAAVACLIAMETFCSVVEAEREWKQTCTNSEHPKRP